MEQVPVARRQDIGLATDCGYQNGIVFGIVGNNARHRLGENDDGRSLVQGNDEASNPPIVVTAQRLNLGPAQHDQNLRQNRQR